MPLSGSIQQDNWTYVGTTSTDKIEIPPRGKNQAYEISVVPRSIKGSRRSAKYGTKQTIHVKGKTAQPLGIQSGEAQHLGSSVFLRWDGCLEDEKDVHYYEIREGAWWGGRVIGMTTDTFCQIPVHHSSATYNYYVKARDKSDNWSDEPIALQVRAPFSNYFADSSSTDYEDDFSGNATGQVNIVYSGDTIRTDAVGTGIYTGEYIDAGSQDDWYIMLGSICKVVDQDPTLDLMGMKLTSQYAKRRTLDSLSSGSLEGSESRELYPLDWHNYKLDSLYASISNLKEPADLDSLVWSKVEFRTSKDAVAWSDWQSAPASAVSATRYVQPRVTLYSAVSGLPMECTELNLTVCKTPVQNGIADPTTTRGDILYRNASEVARLGIGTAGAVLYSDGTDPQWNRLKTPTTEVASLELVGGDLQMVLASESTAGAMSSSSAKVMSGLSQMSQAAIAGTGDVDNLDYAYIKENTGNLSPGGHLLEINDEGDSSLLSFTPDGALTISSDFVGGGVTISAGTVDGIDVSTLGTDFIDHTGGSDPHTQYLLADGSRFVGGNLSHRNNLIVDVGGITSDTGMTNSRLIDFASTTVNEGMVAGDAWVGNYPVAGVVTFGYAGLAEADLNNYALAHTAGGLSAVNCSAGSSVNIVEAGGGSVGGTDIASFTTGSGFVSQFDITTEQDLDVKGDITNSGSYNGQYVEKGLPTTCSIWSWRQTTMNAGTQYNFWSNGSSDVSNGLYIPPGKLLKISRYYGVAKAGATVGTYEGEAGLQTRTISGGGGTTFSIATGGSVAENGFLTFYEESEDPDAPLAIITGSATTTLLTFITPDASNPAALASYKHRVYFEGWWEDA